jgi:hypothetical protein
MIKPERIKRNLAYAGFRQGMLLWTRGPVFAIGMFLSLGPAGLIEPFVLAGAAQAASDSQTQQQTGPVNLLSEVRQIQSIIERIRQHIDTPQAGSLNIMVKNVSFHDLYFQAFTLFTKADRLAFEITRLSTQPPPLPERVQTAASVDNLLNGTRLALTRVINELHLSADIPDELPAGRATLAEIFHVIQGINRQLSLLLERRFTPADIYQEITLAVGYAARMLAAYPDVEIIPEEPPVESGKQISDVFMRLLNCLEIITRISKNVGIQMLEIDAPRIDPMRITTSDAYDLTIAIVARLDLLHKHFKLQKMPIPAFFPGHRFPADVYQRAGLLQEQLSRLMALIESRGMPHIPGEPR